MIGAVGLRFIGSNAHILLDAAVAEEFPCSDHDRKDIFERKKGFNSFFFKTFQATTCLKVLTPKEDLGGLTVG